MKLKLHGFGLLNNLLNEQKTVTIGEAFEDVFYDGVSVKELFEIEARGREIALEERGRAAWREVRDWIYWLEDRAVDVTVKAKERGDKGIYKLSRAVVQAIGPVLAKTRHCESMRAESLSGCEVGYDEISYKVREAMYNIDKVCNEVLGEPCCYFIEPYTLTMVVNDLASGFHRVAELVERVAAKGHEEGKCVWYKGADQSLVDACREWDRLTEIFNKLHLYDGTDYEELKASIRGKHAELRVGSAAGHRVHIDLDEGKLYYYDDDRVVNIIFKRLLEETKRGLLCWIETEDKEDKGVFCKYVRGENVKEVARCLVAVTSMDMRASKPIMWWQDAISRIPELKDLCPELDEYCLVKNAIKYFKTHKRIPAAKGKRAEIVIKGFKK